MTEGLTEEDYQNFKDTSLVAATAFATNAKVGCENEFALFVETEEDLYLPNLSEYVSFEKEENRNIIHLLCDELLNEVRDRIKSVEIYFNPYTTVMDTDIKDANFYNIITRKEIGQDAL
ncbi:MAG: hypothetical protein ACLUOI_20470 [Eisenbergiella sp.]